MSSDSDKSRYVTWKFTHILHISLHRQASRDLAVAANDPHAVLEQIFRSLILTTLPAQVAFIQLRVPRAAFEQCVSNSRANNHMPDLPFEGYIQAPNMIDRVRLTAWFDATWERVIGKLNAHGPFMLGFHNPVPATAAAFVYFQMHGAPALGRGGQPCRNPAVKYSAIHGQCLEN
jgi:hypothetical protein